MGKPRAHELWQRREGDDPEQLTRGIASQVAEWRKRDSSILVSPGLALRWLLRIGQSLFRSVLSTAAIESEAV